ncbi:MAG: hypothetical protein HYX69_21995 [Planctomycetia bacterium]|nr:hypothetical protein [Planctomycetia bacterium]
MWRAPALLRYFYLAHLSKPAACRPIYRLIRRQRLRRIVEFGVGSAERAERMLELAVRTSGADNVVYSGIDQFELRSPDDGPGVSLKMAHCRLVATGARIRLIPGDPYVALSRAPNALGLADLVLIAADQDTTSVSRAWYLIERLLHDSTHVLVETPSAGGGEPAWRHASRDEIRQWAGSGQRRRAA